MVSRGHHLEGAVAVGVHHRLDFVSPVLLTAPELEAEVVPDEVGEVGEGDLGDLVQRAPPAIMAPITRTSMPMGLTFMLTNSATRAGTQVRLRRNQR